jgi:capsular polysaccharide biosynthesis protein
MDAVLAALAPLGFRRYEMETLPLDEQVRLFYDAEVVVAAHGAGLANLLFCGPSARLVELFPHSFVIPTYYLLCCALGLPYRLVRGKEPGRYDDFTVDVPLLLQQLHDVGIT